MFVYIHVYVHMHMCIHSQMDAGTPSFLCFPRPPGISCAKSAVWHHDDERVHGWCVFPSRCQGNSDASTSLAVQQEILADLDAKLEVIDAKLQELEHTQPLSQGSSSPHVEVLCVLVKGMLIL